MFRKMLLVVVIVTVSFLFLPDEVAAANCDPANIKFSEIDYDNAGTDDAEFVELYFVGAANVTNCELHLINGGTDSDYNTVDLTGSYAAGQFVVIGNSGMSPSPDISLGCSTGCIQNGSQDGFALVDTTGGGVNVVAAISYEGAFTYEGVESTDIGCMEPETNPSTAFGSCQNGSTGWQYLDPPTPGSAGPTAVTMSAFTVGATSNAARVLGLTALLLAIIGFTGWILNRRRFA